MSEAPPSSPVPPADLAAVPPGSSPVVSPATPPVLPPLVPPAPPRRSPRRARGGGSRLSTAARIVGHFAHRQRWFLLPLVLVLLCAGVLLVLTGGLSYVAPFVYSIF